jgi:hypothetical protein
MTILLISPDLCYETLRNATNFLPILHNQQKLNLLKPEVHLNNTDNTVLTSQKTQCTSFTKANWLMLFTKMASHCLLYYKEQRNVTTWGKFRIFKFSNRWYKQ